MIKLADTLKAMSDFPVALADSIEFSDGANLQEKFDNKELGGGDSSITLTQEEYEALTEEEKLDGLYYCYDVGKIYKNGVEYARSPIVTVVETEDGHNVDIEDVSSVQSFEIPNGKNAVQFTPSITENGELAWENDGDLPNPPTTPIQTLISTAPLGTVLSFAGSTAPNGYLLCDGASYKVADYKDLYAVIGNTYGGDSTNFNVPDYRETVLVGVGVNTTDADAIVAHDIYGLGEFKDDQLQDHTHTIRTGSNTDGQNITQKDAYSGPVWSTYSSTIKDGRKGTTTHGKQKGVTYIIKAFHTNEGTDAGLNDETITLINQEIDNKTPTIDVQEITDGHSVTIVDKNGEQSFEVPNGKDGVLIDDTVTAGSTTTVWSSSKTKKYIDTASKPVTILASGKSSDTGWNLKRGTQYDFGRLLLINAYNDSYSNTQLNGIGSELVLVMGGYDTAQITSVVVAKTGTTINSFYALERSSSGTLVIKATGNLATSNTGKGKARLSFTFLN